MNAQVAVALDRVNTFPSSFRTYRLPSFSSFDLRLEPAQRAIWMQRKHDTPPSVTLEQLQESRTLDEYLVQQTEHLLCYKVIGSGQTGIFSLGGDLALFCQCIEQGDRRRLEDYAELAASAVWSNVSAHGELRILSLAVVAGEAQGGGFEAALSCNTLVAEKGSSFGFPEPLFGMFPGMGGELLLGTRVDADVARKLVQSSNRYSAEFLYEIGVVDYLVEPGTSAVFVSRLLSRTAGEWPDADRDRMEKRQARLDEISRDSVELSVSQWLEQAMRLDARNIRNMKYILEMQARRAA